jgi:acyl-CoA dehydrogenase
MPIPQHVPLPTTGLAGFDADLSEEETAAQDAAHRFARDVMRPIGRELDKMTAEEVCAQGSLLWNFHDQIVKMGFGPEGLVGLPPAQAARFEGLIVQELAWGDAGLATSAGAGGLPHLLAAASGQQELIDICAGKLGAWIATQQR